MILANSRPCACAGEIKSSLLRSRVNIRDSEKILERVKLRYGQVRALLRTAVHVLSRKNIYLPFDYIRMRCRTSDLSSTQVRYAVQLRSLLYLHCDCEIDMLFKTKTK